MPDKISSPASEKGIVLVLSNSIELRGVLAAMFTRFGYSAILSRNADEAVGYVKEAKDQGRAFRGVILDGVDSISVLHRLVMIDSDVRTILMTDESRHPVAFLHQQLGFKAVLTKPLTLEKVLSAIYHLEDNVPEKTGG